MTKTTVDPHLDNLNVAFDKLKKALKGTKYAPLAGMIVSGIAQYGVGVAISRLTYGLVQGGKLHQRIALKVAVFLITWASKEKIKKVAYRVTAEFFVLFETVGRIFHSPEAS